MFVPQRRLEPNDPYVGEGLVRPYANDWRRGIYGFAHIFGFTRIVRTFCAGSGSLLMFHEVQHKAPVGLTEGIPPRLFEELLTWLKAQGWNFTSLSDVLHWQARLPERFVCLTFDDGYRDFLVGALPVLERYSAPFVLYIPTNALTRDLYAWWLGLRELLLRNDVVDVDAMGKRFNCLGLVQKINAYRTIVSWIRQDYRRKFALASAFVAAGISLRELNERYYMDEHEIKLLSRHPLATIAAHTSSHAALSTLSIDDARLEITANRRFLENLIQKPVVDLAYPYGDENSCGPREGMLAASEGFRSAVTSRGGQIWPQHRNSPFALPRIGISAAESRAVIDGRLSGIRGLLNPGRRIMTW
jgi:peptidoglycan/xylan/chitin deacetylase (PgdA/CDA1 family)